MTEEKYNIKFAAAAVRGYIKREGIAENIESFLLNEPLESLTDSEKAEITALGERLGIKLYYFKKSDRLLPRVSKVIGFLRGVYFESLLDVGSGRGVFLIPFLEEFPHINVTSLDILDKRIRLLSDLKEGGIENLSVKKADICDMPLSPKSVDVVTMLEVLEHIPGVEKAIEAAIKTAKKYVIVTVPSKEDNNPEHIHLLTKEKLTKFFNGFGVYKLSFGGVQGHLFMIANVED